MKRPMLISAIAVVIPALLLVLLGAKAVMPAAVLAALVLILYFIKPLKLTGKISIPAFCIALLIGCISCVSFYGFKVAPLLDFDGTAEVVSGKIVSVPESSENYITFKLKTDSIGNSKKSTTVTATLPVIYKNYLSPYDYISIPNADLSVSRDENYRIDSNSISDGTVLNCKGTSYTTLGTYKKTPFYYCLKFCSSFKNKIDCYMQPNDAGLLKGILFGDQSGIDANTLSDFRASGIAHLLAVSGLHTSLWCGIFMSLLKLLKLRKNLINALTVVFLCLFCIISAFTPSVMRASIIMIVALSARFFKRTHDIYNSLGLVVFVLILFNPYIITSVSFLLSVTATMGVLYANKFNAGKKVNPGKAKSKILIKLLNYLKSTTCVCIFTGLFTLPISAYYFGVYSIISPLTNILCVKLAFYGMITGFSATLLSFLPVTFLKTITVALFKSTHYIFKVITFITAKISSFKYCSVPVHTMWVISGLSILLIIITVFYKTNIPQKSTRKNKVLSVICAVVLAISVITPCTEKVGSELTVINSGYGLNCTLRSGLNYAYFNFETAPSLNSSLLPRATCEALKYVYATGENTDVLGKISVYNPQAVVISEKTHENLLSSNSDTPRNTIVSDNSKFKLNSKITFENIDTSSASCVIIESDDKKIFLIYNYGNSLDYLFNSYGTPDVLILSGYVPSRLPQSVDTLIISTDDTLAEYKNIETVKNQCTSFHSVSENKNYKVRL